MKPRSAIIRHDCQQMYLQAGLERNRPHLHFLTTFFLFLLTSVGDAVWKNINRPLLTKNVVQLAHLLYIVQLPICTSHCRSNFTQANIQTRQCTEKTQHVASKYTIVFSITMFLLKVILIPIYYTLHPV